MPSRYKIVCTVSAKLLLALCTSVYLAGCEKTELDPILKPNGRAAKDAELSAGASTVFVATSKAYDNPAPWVTGSLATRFNLGDMGYHNPRISGEGQGGGLGPVYAGFSCGSCHRNAGRTRPTLWSDGGTGSYGFSSHLVYIARKNGSYYKNYGRVMHDQAIYGSQAEGRLSVTYTEQQYSFPDGETYSLATPHYTVSEWYAEEIPADDLLVSVRIPLRHVGMGQIMSLDTDELLRLAAQSNYPEYGISGKLNYITERGKTFIGVSGNKAQHADLTVELGFSSDMGVTNDRFPEEVSHGQGQMAGYSHYGIQITTREMENVDLYLHGLGVPARRNVTDEAVLRGEKAFYKAKCQLCHTPTLHTRPEATVLLNGTRLPWLQSQVIHPYSDFLLHDMGLELADGLKAGLADGDEWRTTPLWGIGLQERVNGHTYFLHDGRARNLVEAIMWHGGEGAVSRELFRRMPKSERDDLITFIQSL